MRDLPKTCQAEAINFDQKDRIVELNVGAIIVAAGYDVFDPSLIPEYRYDEIPNVVTAIEFERLLSASGPTGGHLDRPSDIAAEARIGSGLGRRFACTSALKTSPISRRILKPVSRGWQQQVAEPGRRCIAEFASRLSRDNDMLAGHEAVADQSVGGKQRGQGDRVALGNAIEGFALAHDMHLMIAADIMAWVARAPALSLCQALLRALDVRNSVAAGAAFSGERRVRFGVRHWQFTRLLVASFIGTEIKPCLCCAPGDQWQHSRDEREEELPHLGEPPAEMVDRR